jgi:hypothetical protein
MLCGQDDAHMHIGYFRGVDNADEIRDLILAQMRGMRDSGLGDPDEPAHITTVDGSSAADPAELRAVLTS